MLATTIDKYCYISCRNLPPFFEHRHRIVYSRIENVRHIEEIEHPAVRETLKWSKQFDGLEIHHDGDLPARAGLGSSSSFTVGLVNALHALKGRMISKSDLAAAAIHIEQDLIGENVGSQDQVSAAFGGFNKIQFNPNGTFDVQPVVLPVSRLELLNSHLMLFFTGFSRLASEIAKTKVDNMVNRTDELTAMHRKVDEGISILSDSQTHIAEFGRLLHESWLLKRSLSDKVSNDKIDGMYEAAIEAGAIGGKILGAGGGGFLLVFAPPEKHGAIRSRLQGLVHVPFKFEETGSQVVLYQPNGL